MAKYDNLVVLQPNAQANDLLVISATTASDVVYSAASGAMFVAGASGAACLARNIVVVKINGTTYYIPASTVVW